MIQESAEVKALREKLSLFDLENHEHIRKVPLSLKGRLHSSIREIVPKGLEALKPYSVLQLQELKLTKERIIGAVVISKRKPPHINGLAIGNDDKNNIFFTDKSGQRVAGYTPLLNSKGKIHIWATTPELFIQLMEHARSLNRGSRGKPF